MAQWYAVIFRSGSKAGEVKSYGTVLSEPFNDTVFEAVPISGPPNANEEWDVATKSIIAKPTPPKTTRQLLKEKTTWTATDRDDAIRELL